MESSKPSNPGRFDTAAVSAPSRLVRDNGPVGEGKSWTSARQREQESESANLHKPRVCVSVQRNKKNLYMCLDRNEHETDCSYQDFQTRRSQPVTVIEEEL